MEFLGILILALLVLWAISRALGKCALALSKSGPLVVKTTLGEILPPELTQLEEEDHYMVRVAGVSYENDDGSSRQDILARCNVPEILQLVRQPNHRHDSNAIQVRRENGEMLGFIPRNEARLMAPELDRGRRYVAVLTRLDGGHRQKPTRGAGVLIVKIKEGGSG